MQNVENVGGNLLPTPENGADYRVALLEGLRSVFNVSPEGQSGQLMQVVRTKLYRALIARSVHPYFYDLFVSSLIERIGEDNVRILPEELLAILLNPAYRQIAIRGYNGSSLASTVGLLENALQFDERAHGYLLNAGKIDPTIAQQRFRQISEAHSLLNGAYRHLGSE